MSEQVLRWKDEILQDVCAILNGQDPPRRDVTLRQCLMYPAIPILCLPCFTWSFLWRVFACPCMVFQHGCGFVCSNNGCTACTDRAIESCCMVAENRYPRFEVDVKSDVRAQYIVRDTLWIIFQQIGHCSDMRKKFRALDLVNQTLLMLKRNPVSLTSKVSKRDIDTWIQF